MADTTEKTTVENPEVIRADIAETRARMSVTLDAIGEKLNPDHLKEELRDKMREQVHETKENIRAATIGKAEKMARNAMDTVDGARHGLIDTIRENPIPAAMVGIGLGWLLMNRSSGEHHDRDVRFTPDPRLQAGGSVGIQETYQERAVITDTGVYTSGRYVAEGPVPISHEEDQGTIDKAKERIGDVGENVRDTAGNVAHRVQDAASGLADRTQHVASKVAHGTQDVASNIAHKAQYQAGRVEDRVQSAMRENPLAVGAVALAIGAAAGMIVPESRREHQMMGSARDRLMDQAQEKVRETGQKVQRVAEEVVEEAGSTARETAREEGLTS